MELEEDCAGKESFAGEEVFNRDESQEMGYVWFLELERDTKQIVAADGCRDNRLIRRRVRQSGDQQCSKMRAYALLTAVARLFHPNN